MDEPAEPQLIDAIKRTSVVRPPKQALATFGTTSVRYYLVTEPAFRGLPIAGNEPESVVREGVVRSERPQVVTPQYLSRHEGFGEHAQEYLDYLIETLGPDAPGLLYKYKNEAMETSVVSGTPDEVSTRIADRLDRDDKRLEAVVRGIDELWDVSLLKFIYEFTNSSARTNFDEMRGRGLLGVDDGVPKDARYRIERMLERARRGEVEPSEVHREIERWGLYDEYEDQFLSLFRGR